MSFRILILAHNMVHSMRNHQLALTATGYWCTVAFIIIGMYIKQSLHDVWCGNTLDVLIKQAHQYNGCYAMCTPVVASTAWHDLHGVAALDDGACTALRNKTSGLRIIW